MSIKTRTNFSGSDWPLEQLTTLKHKQTKPGWIPNQWTYFNWFVLILWWIHNKMKRNQWRWIHLHGFFAVVLLIGMLGPYGILGWMECLWPVQFSGWLVCHSATPLCGQFCMPTSHTTVSAICTAGSHAAVWLMGMPRFHAVFWTMGMPLLHMSVWLKLLP